MTEVVDLFILGIGILVSISIGAFVLHASSRRVS